MVETKGAFQQSKCQHEDNDGIPYVPKHFAKHELSFLVDHPFERLDPRIGHTKSPVVMADHGIDAAIARVLQRLKDGPIEGLPHPKHGPITGAADGARAGDKVLERLMFPINACNKPWKGRRAIPNATSPCCGGLLLRDLWLTFLHGWLGDYRISHRVRGSSAR